MSAAEKYGINFDIVSREHWSQFYHSVRTQTTLAWFGQPGVGKTDMVRYLTKMMGMDYIMVQIGMMEPETISGYPFKSEELIDVDGVKMPVIRHSPAGFAVQCKNSKPSGTVLHLDEVNARASTMFLSHCISLEKRIGELQCDPRTTSVIVSYNPMDCSTGGVDPTPPMISRWGVHEFKADKKSWCAGFPSYWGNTPQLGFGNLENLDPKIHLKVRTLIAGFLRKSDDDRFNNFPADVAGQQRPFTCPRSWDLASRKITSVLQEGGDFNDASPLVAGHVGHYAGEFTLYAIAQNLADPEELLNREIEAFGGQNSEAQWKRTKPSTYQPPRESHDAYMELAALSAAVIADLEPKKLAKTTPARVIAAVRILAAAHTNSNHCDLAHSDVRRIMTAANERSNQLPKFAVNEIKPFSEMLRRTHLLPKYYGEVA